MKKTYRFIILSCFGLILGWLMAIIAPQLIINNLNDEYELIDQDNNFVTNKSFNDKYKLVYFGFTSCPVICPVELQKITDAINALPVSYQKQIQPIFISLDPQQDTPKILKNYISMFAPNMIALTGTQAQIDIIIKKYMVIAKKIKSDNGEYTIDHSSFIYFMSPNDNIIKIFKYNDSANKITTEIQGVFEN